MAQILVDTGAIFALIDRRDANHAAARRILARLKTQRTAPLVTNFVVAETHALLLTRIDAAVARGWLLDLAWPVERVTADDETRARSIIARHTDKTFGYVDSTSFAVMERLGLKTAFAFDPHFAQYGFQVVGLAP